MTIQKPENPVIESVDGDTYQLVTDFPVKVGYWLRQVQFVIPAGMNTDIASVPWYLRWAYDRVSLGILGPVAHDKMCSEEGRLINIQGEHIQLTPFEVHMYFLVLMQIDRIPWRRALLAFLAVLIGGPRWDLDPNWLHQTDKPD